MVVVTIFVNSKLKSIQEFFGSLNFFPVFSSKFQSGCGDANSYYTRSNRVGVATVL